MEQSESIFSVTYQEQIEAIVDTLLPEHTLLVLHAHYAEGYDEISFVELDLEGKEHYGETLNEEGVGIPEIRAYLDKKAIPYQFKDADWRDRKRYS